MKLSTNIIIQFISLLLFSNSAYSCVTEELIQLEKLNPVEQAKSEFLKGNTKFLGVYQYSLIIPAVSGDPYCWNKADLVKIIQGTGDKICSKEHGRLQTIAMNYAFKYNKELLTLAEFYENHKCKNT